MDKFYEERNEVAKTMNRLFARGLTTVSGGNISFRLNDELFCITPSALDKSCLTADKIAIVGFDGTNYTPELKLSIEMEIHRLLLITRKDINAVVHSHPIYASSFSTIEGENQILSKLTAEAYYFMGNIVNVPYHLMGTKPLADEVAKYGEKYDVMLMQNHGAIVLAKDLLGGFDKMDLLERAAQMTVIAKQLESFGCKPKELNKEQCKEIEDMR
ncbi:MAG: class II aldolase/adducin family protein [Sphaerochaetaceae bacterium]|nr:class II aldolase/adducin family protein [Sphaerochaetaceae bacterium]MDC7237410.1 class II aldolase/adducin family protein [Sphaerochaetaceae bacterium]MDC7249929.1 class II aldolase/adducin family protein [Sphaerochaetaceae bacterium]